MKKYREHISQEASITVLLSLVLLLILSLVMTVIEGARRTTAMVFAERALTTSMDSVLAGFYGPLLQEYHLLGLDNPYEEEADKYLDITQKIQEYMSYTLYPSSGIDKEVKLLGLYPCSIESVEVTNATRLVDHQGEVFIHEATEYMKYRTIGDAAEFFLDKLSLLEQPKKVSVLYEEKAKLEEKLVVIDEGVLALMKYVDGVSTGKNGLKKTKKGNIKAESDFIKKILFEHPTMNSVGINNETVFLSLKDKYIDPSIACSLISYSLERVESLLASIAILESRLMANKERIETEYMELEQLEDTLDNSIEADKDCEESIKESIQEVNDKIAELYDERDAIQQDIGIYKNEKMDNINTIIVQGEDVYKLISGSLMASKEAIKELDQIIKAADETEPLIKSYEKNVAMKKEELESEIYENLEEGLDEIKRYQVNEGNGYDFFHMKELISKNYSTLEACLDYLDKGYEAISAEEYIKAKEEFSNAYQELLAYDIEGLNIDYSTLVIDEEDSPDFLESIRGLIKEGIVGLVIDPNTISEREMSSSLLPSVIDMLSEDEESFSFSRLFKDMKIGDKEGATGGLFGSFGNYSLASLIGNAADEMLERLLIQGYIKEHFNRFSIKKEEIERNKPSVLSYEREYLISGKMSDKGNLEAVIVRIILIRTLLNFTTILADKEKWKEAKSIASTLVGFTGLPILIAITQGILMILLAFATSLVDTCALLNDKELPIIKKEIDLEYSDLLLLTRENIHKKAASYTEERGFSYNDYLTLFLCISNQRKLSYRIMDLVQENINIRYGTSVSLQNCIFGYEAKIKYKIKPLFTSFSFIRNYLSTNPYESHIIYAECSY